MRRLLHHNARNRRLLSGVLGAFLLAVLSFSSVFVAAEADHDCSGHDCDVCQEIQACLETCQLVGSATAPTTAAAPVVTAAASAFIPHAYRAPAVTLLSLDVRFDE